MIGSLEHRVVAVAVVAALSTGCGASQGPTPPASSPTPGDDWTLSWSDEFDGPEGSAPDPAKWTAFVSGNGGGNQELQYYTDRPSNASVRGGRLVIHYYDADQLEG
jgi:hypothetical protein